MTEFSNHTQFPNSESQKFHGDATHGDWVVCEEMKQKGGEEEGEGEGKKGEGKGAKGDEARKEGKRKRKMKRKWGHVLFFINFYDYIIYKLFIIIIFIKKI